MRKNSLFTNTKLQIAGWYAAGTGTILILGSLYLYFTVRESYWSAIDREVAALAGTLHDALEPKLQQPGVIGAEINQEVVPNLCIMGQACAISPHRHTLGVTQQEVYYLRFYNLQQQVIAYAGRQPTGQINADVQQAWRSIHDPTGHHYHRYSIILTTVSGQPWGYLQVGRSMEEFDARLTNLRLRIALILPLFVVFIGAMSWWVAGRTMKPIYRSYQKMQQFTADAAHELRTPLMAIQATVDLMKYYEPTEYEQQQTSLTALDRQTQRLIQLAQDLLMLSRLNAPVDRTQIAPCCLNKVLPPLVTGLQPLGQEAGVDLQLMREIANLSVRIEPTHLGQLVTNLVANAIHHTPAGGKVTVKIDRLGKYAVLQVIDTGIGMSAAVQTQVFDRFYRVSSDRSRQAGGAGLGLAIVQSIVALYDGSIEVQSQLQQGSTFTIKLPLVD
jgi:signal transduction histidine kinase